MKFGHGIPIRSDRQAMAFDRGPGRKTGSSRSETRLRAPGNHRRDSLCQQDWLPVADAPRSLPTLAKRLQSLPTHEVAGCLAGNLLQAQRTFPPKKGRHKTPSYLLIDSQSVKTNYEGEERGFHGGKKIKGRSRQVATDTQGNVWAVYVHAANKSDTVEGCVLVDLIFGDLPGVTAVCADQGYRGTFVNFVTEEWGKEVHISGGRQGKGFEVEPMRWVAERTFAWFNGQRRLSKDFEKTTDSSESMIYIAAIARTLRSLVYN